jgi:ribokinase
LTAFFDIMCIGDLDVDFYIAVPAIPGFDQKIAGRHLGQKPGGMGANAAVAMARLGRRVRLLAAVGDDSIGELALSQLTAEGVDLRFVAKRRGVKTFMCVVLLSPSGEKSLIRLESEAYLPQSDDVIAAAFDDVRHVHATYGSPDVAARALELAKERGLSTSLDLEPPDIQNAPERLSSILPLVDTLFLNKEAFARASEVIGAALHPGLLKPDGEIIVTLGAGGCRRITADGILDVPGFTILAVDTTGAGDCFAGAYLARRFEGFSPSEGLEFANAAAALAALDFGAQTAMPAPEAVEALLVKSGRRPDLQIGSMGHNNA